jgi:hypothetical protein
MKREKLKRQVVHLARDIFLKQAFPLQVRHRRRVFVWCCGGGAQHWSCCGARLRSLPSTHFYPSEHLPQEILASVVSELTRRDTHGVFQEPVDKAQVY